MMNDKILTPEKLYISTIAEDDAELAQKYGLGLEIAEYCTAWNMDEFFDETDVTVKRKMACTDHYTFHACFNELHPSAIDKKALQLAHDRYLQAVTLAYEHYKIRKIIVHSGFVPLIYFPAWFEERSIIFWKDLLKELPEDIELCYENVMEEEPFMQLHVVEGVNDPRFGFCFDVGHASAVQKELKEMEWLHAWAPHIRHFHIHNNFGERDIHNALNEGRIPMKEFICEAVKCCPEATFAIQNSRAEASGRFLIDEKLLTV